MGEIERLVPSSVVEQWVYHLRRQRARARDALWLLDQGFTVHDGRNGVPTADASARWRSEQEVIISEVNALLELYDSINLHRPAVGVEEASS
ncbi:MULTISPECIES: hypothetical protein [unclassified Sphingomonas]|uniref:hypothetical protein n=1 Tax=unclassified Sphingomonas TaxID=196159 RepID=UPI00226A5746|nr:MULTISPECIES: hypothetical protein [unclassified Sphingomonas]